MVKRLIAWANTKGPKWVSALVKLGSFVFGVLVLKHQAFDVTNVQPLLIFLGLWMCGVPPATFFDSIRRVGQTADEALAGMTTGVPKPNEIDTTPEPPRQEAEREPTTKEPKQ